MHKKIISIAIVGATLIGSIAPLAQAGRVPGPGCGAYCVEAYSSDWFTDVFRANELAIVRLSGDFDTDLDLYVFDANWNLIASDTDMTDQCIVSFTPRWTGTFHIQVRNRGGVYNRYTMGTN